MDPAALLDPKGARQRADNRKPSSPESLGPQLMDNGEATQQQQQQQSHQQNNIPLPSAQFQQFDPRALLNPKSVPKRPAVEQELERGREVESETPGQVSLVERLHNVHERTASPAKRPRTDDEQKKKPQSNIGSGGALALQQNKSGQPTSTAGPSIDLTMSDDESEIQVVKDNSSQEICIGAIGRAYVQAHTVPFPDPKKYHGNYGQQSVLRVHLRRGGGQKATMIIMVTDPTGREFGRIDYKTARALAPLMDSSAANGLKWASYTEPRRKQPSEGGPGSPCTALISATIQLYCSRKHAQTIGNFLKRNQIDLLPPRHDVYKYDYFNPQTLDQLNVKEASQATFEGYAARNVSGGNFPLRSLEEIRSDVHNMFSTMVSSDDLPQREPSQTIRTPLYKHQKQALYFLWDKEQDLQGEEADKRKDSLWRPKYRDNGRKSYLHVITGEEVAQRPPSCRGGILADEMGLGKTLSILSLIADPDSVAAAHDFSRMAPRPTTSMIQPVLNSRATLLVCPLSTMYNWKDQLEKHFPVGQGLKWTNYHGKQRSNFSSKSLANHDLVITTYQMIQMDFNDKNMPLPWVNWFRIVLDEAHAIRNTGTKQSLAACTLAAQRRWAVTGTPVQNRLEDLGALFRFLHLQSFDSSAGFNHHILTPFKNADQEVVEKLQLLVRSVTLRRLKESVLEIELPSRSDHVVRLQFSKEEQKLHDWFEADSARKVNAVTSGEKLGGRSYARILTAITNLRLICAHGRDLLSDEALKLTDGMTYDNPMEIDDEGESDSPILTRTQAYDMLELLDQTDTDECQYCRTNLLQGDDTDDDDESDAKADIIGYMTPCYQVVCAKHAKKLREDLNMKALPDGSGLALCPFCETRIRPVPYELKHSDFRVYLEDKERMKRDPKLAKKIGGYTGPHTKTKALLEDLGEHREWSNNNPTEPPIKSVVFSTWTTHLDLIEIALNNYGHKYVRLDGRMPRAARNRSLEAFDKDDTVTIILVSIGAGGLGLNLTKANKAYVMEPQFNPAAEAQAVDRVHRLGQTREVTIKRFIMDNSFEEKMLDLQRKKRDLANLAMARERSSKEQAARQRLEDLRSLFR